MRRPFYLAKRERFMSQQALEAFRSKLAQDEALRNEMTRHLSQDGKRSTASVADMAAFAKSHGYDVSPEEVEGAMELSDDQLETVAGGSLNAYSQLSLNGGSYSVDSFSLNFAKVEISY
jgi:predicted ribosomally synthesized peptide with nif11-like leader